MREFKVGLIGFLAISDEEVGLSLGAKRARECFFFLFHLTRFYFWLMGIFVEPSQGGLKLPAQNKKGPLAFFILVFFLSFFPSPLSEVFFHELKDPYWTMAV